MIKLKVNNKEYTLKFGYRVLAKTAVLKDVVSLRNKFSVSEEDQEQAITDNIDELIKTNSNLVLAGLQKFHEEYTVDYDDEKSVKDGLEKVYDLMDDYMDDPESKAVIDLFGEMVEDLVENGFLSKMSPKMEEVATELDATVIPMDHQTATKK